MVLGSIIGKGNTAEVYELRDNDEKVLKLFYEPIPFEYIEKEHQISRIISQMGIPSPFVEDILQLNRRYGIIYEKIKGENFTRVVSSKPLLLKKNAYVLAEIQASFHGKSSKQLDSQKEYLSETISKADLLRNMEKEEILKYLRLLPEDNKVCHGDYHTDNIILMEEKPKILDWMTGTSGNPCGDVARTLTILRYSYLPKDMPKITKLLVNSTRQAFASFYLNAYVKLTNTSVDCINEWFLPVMASRLVEGIPEQEKHMLLEKIHDQLQNLRIKK